LGLKELSRDVKSDILPVITLGKWPRSEDIQASMDEVLEAMDGLPCILDVTREATHHNESSSKLINGLNGFQSWRDFVGRYDSVIPVIQLDNSARVRDLTLQAVELEKSKGQIVFKIVDFESDTDKVISIMAALERPEDALIILDMGYIRNAVPMAASAAIRIINKLRNEIPESSICLTSTSFPQTVSSFVFDSNATRGSIDILERELYEIVGGRSVCLYGDHSSIHSVVYPDSQGRYVPRIDLPLDGSWYFERRPDSLKDGYIDAARAVLKVYPYVNSSTEWGAEKIKRAAAGDIDKMGSPAKWIAVRVNLHISRQLSLSRAIINNTDVDNNFDE
jgi:hypothetical protein